MAEGPDPIGVAADAVPRPRGWLRQALRRLWHPRSQHSLAYHLSLLCAALLAPVLLVSAGWSYAYVGARHDALQDSALQRARSILEALDTEIEGRMDMLRILASALQSAGQGELGSLTRQAGILMQGDVTLRTLEGRPLAGGDSLPEDPEGEASVRRSLTPALSGLLRTPSGGFALRLTMPVLNERGLRYLLSLTLDPMLLRHRLLSSGLPPGWIAVVTDGQRRVIARSEGNEAMIGRLISEEAYLSTDGESGFWRGRNFDGETVLFAHLRSARTGWGVGVMVPTRIAEAPLRRSLLLFGISSALLAALALGLAVVFAHRIAEPVRALARVARRLGTGQAVRPTPSPVRELDAVNLALMEAGAALHRRGRDLAESEARLTRAVQAARMATWEWNRDTDALTGSKGREALYNAPEAALASRALLMESILPEDRGLVRAALARALDPEGPGVYEAQFRVAGPGGEERWLQSQGAVVQRDSDGRVLRLAGVVMDVTLAQHAAERERNLAKEVDHRARNVLTVVQSILRMSRSDDPHAFLETVTGRVGVLARAHTLLARSRWSGAELQELASDAMEAHGEAGRVTLSGPSVMLAMQAVQPLAQILHELVTNARRHGALSVPDGHVTLSWQQQEGGLSLTWRERGGPPAHQPEKPGFGLRVVENTLRWQLAGGLDHRWDRAGFSCVLRLPERALRRKIVPWQPAPLLAVGEAERYLAPPARPAPPAPPERRRHGAWH